MNQKRVAMVTGAMGGIGSVTCKQLADAGYQVIAVGRKRTREQMNAWMEQYDLSDRNVHPLMMDVTDHGACLEGIRYVMEQYGRVDVLVNNAGITRDGQFKKMSPEHWHQVMDTNLNSLFNVTQPLFATMCEQGFGRIINVTSINGLKGQFGQVNYSAAKAGMIGFTKALALEGARKGVTVNAVAPGYTMTPMVAAMKPEVLESITSAIPAQRLAEPEEIAGAIRFLASEQAGYITGETLSLNGGQHMH